MSLLRPSPRRLRARATLIASLAALAAAGTSAGAAQASTIAASSSHTCAIVEGGGVKCWGNNESGQLGNGTLTSSSSPVAVTGITDAVAIAADFGQSCALHATGSVSCWGDARIGLDDGAEHKTLPVPVSGISDAIAISAGGSTVCVVRAGGQVSCWGAANGFGAGSSQPQPMADITDATGVMRNSSLTCVSTQSAGARCRTYEVLQPDNAVRFSPVPVDVPLPADVTSIAGAIGGHLCFSIAGGQARCSGFNNYGQVGNGAAGSTYVREVQDVVGVADAVALTAQRASSCALQRSGRVTCWGSNLDGALGDGAPISWEAAPTTPSGRMPVTVPGIETATQIAGGEGHVCVALADGTMRCWGQSYHGQIGHGKNEPALKPVTVPGVQLPAWTANYPDGTPPGGASAGVVATRLSAQVSSVARKAARAKSKLTLVDGLLGIADLRVGASGKSCPKSVVLQVSAGKKKHRQSLALSRIAKTRCELSGVLRLPQTLASAKKVVVQVTAGSAKSRAITVRRG